MSLENDGSGENGGANRRRIHLREISGESDSPAETVGQELRAARLRRGDEIAQVSRALKIRKDHLEALEEDRLEDLPGKTYAIGFVRSYARHLGLDSAQYVERFKQEISGRPDEQAREPAPIHQDDSRRLPQGWRLIAGMVVVLLGVGVWHLLSSGGDANQPVPPAPVLNPPKVAVAPPPQPIVAPEQRATPSPATDSVPPADPSEQTATATPPPAAGPTTPATQATRGQAATPAPVASAPAQAETPAPSPGVDAAAVPEGGRTYGQQNLNPRVILRLRADTRLTVRGEDGTMYINRDLKAGDVYQVPNTPGLTMATTNGAAVEVNLDGIALGRAGQQEQVLGRVSLDPQSLVDRFNRR
jgi:cytoskeleton protein RodZ